MQLFIRTPILLVCVLTLFLGSCTELKMRDAQVSDEDSIQIDGGNRNISPSDTRESSTTYNEPSQVDSSTIEQFAECTVEGVLRCDKSGGALRERCEGGGWVSAEPCRDGEVCDMANTEQPGTCANATELCQGSSGESICHGSVMHLCSDNAISVEQEECLSERHCQTGLERGICAVCLPGEYRCDENRLEKCSDDGGDFMLSETCATVALCNANAGACTDKVCLPDSFKCTSNDMLTRCKVDETGFEDYQQCDPGMCDGEEKQCDKCVAESVRCEDDAVIRCDASGQEELKEPCPYNKSHCVGQGKCVECRVGLSDCASNEYCNPKDNTCVKCLEDGDCHVELDCRVGYCTADNECDIRDATEGTRCGSSSSGYCSGAGVCEECLTNDHCDGACTPSTDSNPYTCVECNSSSDCLGNLPCVNHLCEGCLSNSECSENELCIDQRCQEIYRLCSSNSNCDSGTFCYGGMCTTSCTGGCSDPPGDWTSICVLNAFEAHCYISCNSLNLCPEGLTCCKGCDTISQPAQSYCAP